MENENTEIEETCREIRIREFFEQVNNNPPKATSGNLLKIIHNYCLHCVGYVYKELELCTGGKPDSFGLTCPFYHFRMGKNPNPSKIRQKHGKIMAETHGFKKFGTANRQDNPKNAGLLGSGAGSSKGSDEKGKNNVNNEVEKG